MGDRSVRAGKLALGAGIACGAAVPFASGVWLWLSLALALAVAWTWLAGLWRHGLRGLPGSQLDLSAIPIGAVVLVSTGTGLAICELALALIETRYADAPELVDLPRVDAAMPGPPADDLDVSLPPRVREKIERMQRAPIMPASWNLREIESRSGQHDPKYWHGALHLYDENNFRRDTPFPPRRDGVFRVMVVGDSLTYGEGIGEFFTYPRALERDLSAEFRVEVLNLGASGSQSEDILENVREFVPELQPDLVVYGVCLNDFLPKDHDQEVRYQVPIPRKLKRMLVRRTRLGRLVEDRYAAIMRRLGLRATFFSELLEDFDGYRERFRRDVAAMNAFVVGYGLPPVVALVVDQLPKMDGDGRKLALAAEEELARAGMTVVDTEEYYRRYDGRDFRVSRWEGHPNEEANALFARMLYRALRDRDDLAEFRRRTPGPR